MIESIVLKVNHFMHTFVRELDLAYYKYLFYEGSKEDVVKALEKYQTPSGGFAFGLEPDNLNPNPTAIQTWTAIGYIWDLKLDDNHPMVVKILDYLESSMDENGFYPTTIQSNNEYPHAVWWNYDEKTCYWGYNPSVALWAFLYSKRKTLKVKKLLVDAFYQFMKHPTEEMHELKCYIDAYEWLYDVRDDFLFFNSYENELKDHVIALLDDYHADPNVYGPTPMTFCSDPKDHIYPLIKEKINMQLPSVIESIQDKPIWDIPFTWGQFDDEFKKAKIHWQGITAIKNLKFIK